MENTPEQEKNLINEGIETYQYKFVLARVNHYASVKLHDILITASDKDKYKVTYIDPKFNLLYGRKICQSGKLSKNLIHITGMFKMLRIDPQQIDATLLGIEYDPNEAVKQQALEKKKAAYQRQKQRVKIFKKLNTHEERYQWCKDNLSVGQKIWMVPTYQDKDAIHHSCIVEKIHEDFLKINHAKNSDLNINYGQIHWYNMYLAEPTTYEGNI